MQCSMPLACSNEGWRLPLPPRLRPSLELASADMGNIYHRFRPYRLALPAEIKQEPGTHPLKAEPQEVIKSEIVPVTPAEALATSSLPHAFCSGLPLPMCSLAAFQTPQQQLRAKHGHQLQALPGFAPKTSGGSLIMSFVAALSTGTSCRPRMGTTASSIRCAL